ncbi:uncharacterized protein At1g76070-like [Eucalyptus grandis]|uniref:uncharacterized protein At1g76070-like n=1 Tax=Eucalyptus grandis TaxID=71139 RepID=UPI00192E9A4D|nr:uncharacterized protein At1g76070-like [Eucalyptus grandis]
MRRFASSQNVLANFDWTAQVAPVDATEQRNCYFDDKDRDKEERDDDDGDEVVIPFSSPILVGGVESKAKKEVNLWKRRTMLTLNHFACDIPIILQM